MRSTRSRRNSKLSRFKRLSRSVYGRFCIPDSFFGKFTLNTLKQINVANSGWGSNYGVTLNQWSDIRFVGTYQKSDIPRYETIYDE